MIDIYIIYLFFYEKCSIALSGDALKQLDIDLISIKRNDFFPRKEYYDNQLISLAIFSQGNN